METRAAAKRKEGPGTSKASNTEAAPPAAKRSRRGSQTNPAQASAGGRTTSRSKGAKQTAPRNRSRNTPDIVTTAAAASDQALPAAVLESEAPKPAQKEAAPTSAPAAAASPGNMDASGRRGSKGDPPSGGAEDDRVSAAKVFSCAASLLLPCFALSELALSTDILCDLLHYRILGTFLDATWVQQLAGMAALRHHGVCCWHQHTAVGFD